MTQRFGNIRLLASAILMTLAVPNPTSAHGITERASVDTGGRQGNRITFAPAAISANGRFVAFYSRSTNLAANDTNRVDDVFVRDRWQNVTERVSVGHDGAQGNDASFRPAISADGRFVAFASAATNLVAGDTNGQIDVFVRDRTAGTTQRVNVGSDGAQSKGNSGDPAISADGRFVSFFSTASNLVRHDTNGATDVFVHDRITGKTERANVGASGTQANFGSAESALSADGRYVVFESSAEKLVPGDTNGWGDVFVRDREAGTTQRVSVGQGGAQANLYSQFGAISADGRFVVFVSAATNLVPGGSNGQWGMFVRDRKAGTTQRVCLGPRGALPDWYSEWPTISADGRTIAFTSGARNLVPNDTNNALDVFVCDRVEGRTRRVSLGPGERQGNEDSVGAVISADGRSIAFGSTASNLVPGDTNGAADTFVRTLVP